MQLSPVLGVLALDGREYEAVSRCGIQQVAVLPVLAKSVRGLALLTVTVRGGSIPTQRPLVGTVNWNRSEGGNRKVAGYLSQSFRSSRGDVYRGA